MPSDGFCIFCFKSWIGTQIRGIEWRILQLNMKCQLKKQNIVSLVFIENSGVRIKMVRNSDRHANDRGVSS